jgi:hypothetical protein
MDTEGSLRELRNAVAALERRNRRLARTAHAAMAAAVLAALSPAPLRPAVARAAAPAPADSVLRVRELVVVDSAGTERVRIAAPLPDPIMLGRRFRRDDPVSGILIYDAEGNERGGYVTGDESRGAALTLDEIMRAAVHVGVQDRGEAHVQLGNGMGGFGTLGVTMQSGAYLRLERNGEAVAVLGDTAAGRQP